MENAKSYAQKSSQERGDGRSHYAIRKREPGSDGHPQQRRIKLHVKKRGPRTIASQRSAENIRQEVCEIYEGENTKCSRISCIVRRAAVNDRKRCLWIQRN